MALTPEQLAELQRLRQMFAPLAEQERRRQQAQWNAEQMANKKADGGQPEEMINTDRFRRMYDAPEPTMAERVGDVLKAGAQRGMEAMFPIRKIGRLGIEQELKRQDAMRAQDPLAWQKAMRSGQAEADRGYGYMENSVRKTLGMKPVWFNKGRITPVEMSEEELYKKAEGGNVSIDGMRYALTMAKGGTSKAKGPKKTVKAYKMFRVDPKRPGQLFPLFVDADTPVPMGQWVDAIEGAMANGKVKSKIGPLAYRPGWHAGDLPLAHHIGDKDDEQNAEVARIQALRQAMLADIGDDKEGKKIVKKMYPYPSWLNAPRLRRPNEIWAEIEMPNDVDWQTEATRRGMNPAGKFIAGEAHITDQLPKGGHYRYKTNSNMTGNWLIGGSMKVNKILHDAEVQAINEAAGAADLPRLKPMDKEKFGFDKGGSVSHSAPDEWIAEELANYRDPKSTKISDWKWRKMKDVRKDMPIIEVPDYIQRGYGEFMNEQLKRAQAGELSPRDLLKAFTITQSSIGRGGLPHSTATKTGMKLPNTGGEVRPEGAFAEWLGSPMGQLYLDLAERGEIDPRVLKDIQQKFSPFGKQNQLTDQMTYAAQHMPEMAKRMNQAVTGSTDEYRDWAEQMKGVAGAKSGFVGSMIGRGDLPTLDARQLNLHALPANVGIGSIMNRGKGKGAREAVDRLAARQKAMKLKLDPSLAPHYQHLVHHAVWDKAGDNQTTHDDIIKAMRGYSKGGSILKEIEEYIRKKHGEHGAKRVQRAADEIQGLEGMYTPEALQYAFDRPHTGLMSMDPALFERYAIPLFDPKNISEDDYAEENPDDDLHERVRYLSLIKGGFDEVPFLELGHRDPEYLPSIEGHEGRHRSRALAKKGMTKSLVQLMPSDRLRLIMPKGSNEKSVEKLNKVLGEHRLVTPENRTLLPADLTAKQHRNLENRNLVAANRPQLPEVYAKGGPTHAHQLDIEERPL